MLGVPWEKVEVTWGSTAKNLPWTCVSGGSQTTHAMTRAAYAVGEGGPEALQEIAAKDLGGSPADYEVANERVFRKGGGAGMSLAQAAQRAIQLGGVYDGHEVTDPEVNRSRRLRCTGWRARDWWSAARDKYPHDGQTFSFVASFAEVQVDLETGKYHLTDFLAVADVGTVIHPRALGGQVMGRSVLGIAHAIGQKWVYDQHYGLPIAKRMHYNKPPTIMDLPVDMKWDALNIPDPETPVGARGIGEPPVGGGCAAVLNAIADAVGDEVFRQRAGEPRHDPGIARSRTAHAGRPAGAHLRRQPAKALQTDLILRIPV